MSTKKALLETQAIELMELIEDTVSHFCKENTVSGEKAWVMIRSLSCYKLEQFPSAVDTYQEFEDVVNEEET